MRVWEGTELPSYCSIESVVVKMTEKHHFAALQEIRGWTTEEVICALKNNGLNECVDVCKKREVTGEKLLELSEMKLGLWKKDLSIGNIRKLASFIQDISRMPTKYTLCTVSSYSDDAWDTDFDDAESEEEEKHKSKSNTSSHGEAQLEGRKSEPRALKNGNSYAQNSVNKSIFSKLNDNQLSPKISKPPFLNANGTKDTPKKIKCLDSQKPTVPSRPPSLHLKSSSSSDNAESKLPVPPAFDNEGLVLREICDKLQLESDIMDEYESIDDEILHAEILKGRRCHLSDFGRLINKRTSLEKTSENSPSHHCEKDYTRDEFSLTLPKNVCSSYQKTNILSQQSSKPNTKCVTENEEKMPASDSLEQCETLMQRSRKLSDICREQFENFQLNSLALSYSESKPDSPVNLTKCTKIKERNLTTGASPKSRSSNGIKEDLTNERNKEENISKNILNDEVYESILEHVSSKDVQIANCEYSDGYLLPKAPPSLPPKPKQISSNAKSLEAVNSGESTVLPESVRYLGSQKQTTSQKSQEKSFPDGKKNYTLPLTRPANSFITDTPRPGASRPLPPPPVSVGNINEDRDQRAIKIPLVQMPWYFNVDRAKGEEILQNCEDGTFMIRPSTKTQNALTLTLKYGKRPFNISVRLRSDGKFALGTAKPSEQTFSSVEELVNYYSANELLLYTNGKQAGIVVLTSPPRKD